ncbi:hypothetical protein [Oceanospirillum sanctuarii]|uniref:hypothetical protein n=1 Tax=Oceanospirillum sanctuarii TaxID=1434821 RepID=UPI001122CA39|nr:hypothetical protein [Oceanospirillum sanctuarii]
MSYRKRALKKLLGLSKQASSNIAASLLLLVIDKGAAYLCSGRRFDLRIKLGLVKTNVSTENRVYLISSDCCQELMQNVIQLELYETALAVEFHITIQVNMLEHPETCRMTLFLPDQGVIENYGISRKYDDFSGMHIKAAVLFNGLDGLKINKKTFTESVRISFSDNRLMLQKIGDLFCIYETFLVSLKSQISWIRELDKQYVKWLADLLKGIHSSVSIRLLEKQVYFSFGDIELRMPAANTSAICFTHSSDDILAELKEEALPIRLSDLRNGLVRQRPGKNVQVQLSVPVNIKGITIEAFTVSYDQLNRALQIYGEPECWLHYPELNSLQIVFHRQLLENTRQLDYLTAELSFSENFETVLER